MMIQIFSFKNKVIETADTLLCLINVLLLISIVVFLIFLTQKWSNSDFHETDTCNKSLLSYHITAMVFAGQAFLIEYDHGK